jgi:protein SMG8
VWPELQVNLCKALLLLFHISHIVVIVNPSPHFDLSYINLFRILDSSRQKLQPFITDMLNSFSSLQPDWVCTTLTTLTIKLIYLIKVYLKNYF